MTLDSQPIHIPKLTIRLTSVVLVFATVLALAYLLLVHFPLQEKLPGLNTKEGRKVFQNLSHRVQESAQAAIHELQNIATLAEVRNLNYAEMNELFMAKEKDNQGKSFQFLLALDATGTVLVRPSNRLYEGRNLHKEELFQKPFSTHKPCLEKARLIIPPPQDRSGPVRLSLIMSVPIFDKKGSCVGVLAGGLNLNGPLQRVLHEEVSSDYPRAILLTTAGRKIADSATTIENHGASDESTHPMFHRATDKLENAAFSHRGVDHFGFVAKLPETGWVLILHSRLGSTLEVAETIVSGVAWLLALVMTALLVGVLLYGSRIILPIDRLTASLVHFGETGESTKLDDTKSSGEIGKAITAFNRMMVERSQIESDLLQQRQELEELAGELIDIEQKTRYEVATHLHDDIAQQLAAAKIRMEMLVNKQNSDAEEDSLAITIDLLSGCISGTSAITNKLAEPSLRQLGLVKAAQDLVEFYQENHDVDFSFTHQNVTQTIGEGMADTLYRGLRELLHNVVKHAQAKRVLVAMHCQSEMLCIRVEDDGVGLATLSATAREGQAGRFGLFSLRERIRQLGGEVSIESSPNQGCRITVEVPISS